MVYEQHYLEEFGALESSLDQIVRRIAVNVVRLCR